MSYFNPKYRTGKIKCIVCGTELNEESDDETLCKKCKSLGYETDFPEICKIAHCDIARSFPTCIFDCKVLCEEDLEELLEKYW